MEVVHCLTISNDGLVYVCDRFGDRIRIYDKMGNLKSTIEIPWKPATPVPAGTKRENGGGALAIGFSRDAAQRFLFLINQNTSLIDVIERQTGRLLSSFGGGAGSYPGQFDQPHDIAVDSRGDIYVAENRGKRVQKFKLVGQ
jgi:sugar lactone lactonase YvrE